MRKPKTKSNLVTYKIGKDLDDKLKQAARTSCNFWNEYIDPKSDVVVRLGIESLDDETVAAAWEPEKKGDGVFGRIDFNGKLLEKATPCELAGTVIHEIAHVLGFGWGDWRRLFDHHTGRFHHTVVTACPELKDMVVEREGGSGTALMHWDESKFGAELMTGWDNARLHVLPVTVSVMGMLGHTVHKRLSGRMALGKLIGRHEGVAFPAAMKARACLIEREHVVNTKVRETLPSRRWV